MKVLRKQRRDASRSKPKPPSFVSVASKTFYPPPFSLLAANRLFSSLIRPTKHPTVRLLTAKRNSFAVLVVLGSIRRILAEVSDSNDWASATTTLCVYVFSLGEKERVYLYKTSHSCVWVWRHRHTCTFTPYVLCELTEWTREIEGKRERERAFRYYHSVCEGVDCTALFISSFCHIRRNAGSVTLANFGEFLLSMHWNLKGRVLSMKLEQC